MAPFGFDQTPEAPGGLFTEGVATITKAEFAEGKYGVQFQLHLLPEDSDTEITLFYAMGTIKDQPRVVLDGGERVDGPNYRKGSKLDCLLTAWNKAGAPALRGSNASSFVGYTFEWASLPMGDITGREVVIEGKVAMATVPTKYLGSANAIDETAMAEAISVALAAGPKKLIGIVMALPEGPMREAGATTGREIIDRMVADGLVSEDGGLYSLVG